MDNHAVFSLQFTALGPCFKLLWTLVSLFDHMTNTWDVWQYIYIVIHNII